MFWPMLLLLLTVCGVAVLGVFAIRVGLEVRRFTHQVSDSAEQLARAVEDLDRAATPLASRARRLRER